MAYGLAPDRLARGRAGDRLIFTDTQWSAGPAGARLHRPGDIKLVRARPPMPMHRGPCLTVKTRRRKNHFGGWQPAQPEHPEQPVQPEQPQPLLCPR